MQMLQAPLIVHVVQPNRRLTVHAAVQWRRLVALVAVNHNLLNNIHCNHGNVVCNKSNIGIANRRIAKRWSLIFTFKLN